MGIALFTISRLLSPLRALAGGRAATRLRRSATVPASAFLAPASAAGATVAPPRDASGAAMATAPAANAMPLRVVRVAEAGYRPGCAGRMVISGRMADVCAELDRLAAREACLVQH